MAATLIARGPSTIRMKFLPGIRGPIGIAADPTSLRTALETMAPTIPTTLPATAGKLWLNDGVLCIS